MYKYFLALFSVPVVLMGIINTSFPLILSILDNDAMSIFDVRWPVLKTPRFTEGS